jgi:hypothetical protein
LDNNSKVLLSVVVVVEDKGCSETPGIIVLLLERIRIKIREEEVWAVRSEETTQRRHRHRVDYSGIRITILLSNNKEEEEEEEEDCSGDLQRVVVEGCSEEEVLQVDRVCSENRLVRRAR